MAKVRVVKASEVVPFNPDGEGGPYNSRLLIESDGVGSTKLQLNYSTLKPGCAPGPAAAHPAPYDEAYYILRGSARMEFDDGADVYEVGPDTAIFIPGGTLHRIINTGDEDLVFLTIWPLTPDRSGVNDVVDMRKKAWGTTFKKVNDCSDKK